jgi:histidinol-phosphate aminotransferase
VAAGVAALSDQEFMRRSVEKICVERERLQKEIQSYPSQANFLCIKTAETSHEFVEKFLERGVIIRDCRSFRGAGEHHARVTVGTPAENDRLLSAFREICA